MYSLSFAWLAKVNLYMERIMLMQGNWSVGHLQSTCQVPAISSRLKLIQIPERRALI